MICLKYCGIIMKRHFAFLSLTILLLLLVECLPSAAAQTNNIQALIKVGDIIPFGKHNWSVLEIKDGRALVLSEKVIEKRAYHSNSIRVTWEDCDLRRYLNSTFYNSFSAENKAGIAEARIINDDNQWFRIKGGNNTTDKIFLLSIEEVVKYFGDSGQLKNKNPKSRYQIEDQYNSARKAVDTNGKSSWWWLRSPGYVSHHAAFVTDSGSVRSRGDNGVNDTNGGVRPALWLTEDQVLRIFRISSEEFFKLCQSGTPQQIQTAIQRGADVNAQDTRGDNWTPLMYAAESNSNPESLSVLIKAGANVNFVSRNTWTPLRLAARNNKNLEVISALIKAGANINAQEGRRTALMWAAAENKNPQIVATLLDAGADVHALSRDDNKKALDFADENDFLRGTAVYERLKTLTTRQTPEIIVSLSKASKVGDIIKFGKYNWRVLDVQDGKALIITENIVEKRPYNEQMEEVTWETCTLRKYLNSEFLQELSVKEWQLIVETRINNPDNLWNGTSGGNNTTDRVFLLTLEEVDKYFGDSGDYLNKKRKILDGKKWVSANDGVAFSNTNDIDRIAKFKNEASWWWLRSPGRSSFTAASISGDGSVNVISRNDVYFDSGGVRPALWLKMGEFTPGVSNDAADN